MKLKSKNKPKSKVKKYDVGGDANSSNNWTNLTKVQQSEGVAQPKTGVSASQVSGYAGMAAGALNGVMPQGKYKTTSTAGNVFGGIKEVGKSVPVIGGFVQAGDMLGKGFEAGIDKANQKKGASRDVGASFSAFAQGIADPIAEHQKVWDLQKQKKISTGEAIGWSALNFLGGAGIGNAVLEKKNKKDLHPELKVNAPEDTQNPFNQQGDYFLQNLDNNPVMAKNGGSLRGISKYANGGELEHYNLPLHKNIDPNLANAQLDNKGVQINAKETIMRKENGGDYVFSDSLKKEGKTFAEHSKKIENKTKKPYYDPAALKVKEYQLGKLQQENDVAREKVEKKENGGSFPMYGNGGSENVSPELEQYYRHDRFKAKPLNPDDPSYYEKVWDFNNQEEPIEMTSMQPSLLQSTSSLQPTLTKYNNLTTPAPKVPKTGSNNLTTGDYIQLAGSAVAPIANLAMGLKKSEKVKAHLDGTQYSNPRIAKDYNPIYLAENSAAKDIDNNSLSDSVRRAARTSLASNTQGALSDYSLKVDNANKMLQMQQEQAEAGTNRFNAQSLVNRDTAQAQNEAVKRSFTSTGLGQLGQSAVDFGRFKNQGKTNEIEYSTLQSLAANYGLDPKEYSDFLKSKGVKIKYR